MTRDVLKKAGSRTDLANDPSDVRPEVSLILGAELSAGNGKRLARIPANDKIHDSTPRTSIE